MTAKRAFLIGGQLQRLQSLMLVLRERADRCTTESERLRVEACAERYDDQYNALLRLQGGICSTNLRLDRDHEELSILVRSLTKSFDESDCGDERSALEGCITRYNAQLVEVERLMALEDNDVGC